MRRPFIPRPMVGSSVERGAIRDKNRKHRINDEIAGTQVRVVDEEGAMLGIMPIIQALQKAFDENKDLVEIAPQAEPPVCKIIDYGKFAYELQKREKQQKKAQHQQLLKEVRFKWRTDTHDFDFKARHARDFLGEGHKVKATVMFKGREIVHQEIGLKLLERFVEALADVAKIDQPIHPEGRTLSVTLTPEKVVKKPKSTTEP